MSFEYEGKLYDEVSVARTSEVVDSKFSTRTIKPGVCFSNAYEVTKRLADLDVLCVEGFVYFEGENKSEDVIRYHCWNKREEVYFDLTRDLIWQNFPPTKVKAYYYFPVGAFAYSDYQANAKELVGGKGIEMISEAENIAIALDSELQASKKLPPKSL